ncbi:MAG: hypothetical protein ACPHK8_07605 [Thermoplasmatota archaeon]
MKIALDWHDTCVYLEDDEPNYECPESMARARPNHPVLDQVRRLMEKNHEFVIITGARECTRHVIEAQCEIYLGTVLPTYCQQTWNGWDALSAFKKASMKASNAALLVDDQLLMRDAVREQGAAALTPQQFAAGYLPELIA